MAALSPALVLYADDPVATRRFYEMIGLTFRTERHGKGPEHAVHDFGGFVLEIYSKPKLFGDVRGPCQHIHIIIPVADVPAAIRILEADSRITKPGITPQGPIVSTLDPDLIQVILVQR